MKIHRALVGLFSSYSSIPPSHSFHKSNWIQNSSTKKPSDQRIVNIASLQVGIQLPALPHFLSKSSCRINFYVSFCFVLLKSRYNFTSLNGFHKINKTIPFTHNKTDSLKTPSMKLTKPPHNTRLLPLNFPISLHVLPPLYRVPSLPPPFVGFPYKIWRIRLSTTHQSHSYPIQNTQDRD